MSRRPELETLHRLRGVYGPSGLDRWGRWFFILFFLGVCAPLCWLLAAGELPPKPGHLPLAIAVWMLMPLSLALGLYALFTPHPTYEFDGTAVIARRGRRVAWRMPLDEIERVDRHDEKANDQSLHLIGKDGQVRTVNFYTGLRHDWRALRRRGVPPLDPPPQKD